MAKSKTSGLTKHQKELFSAMESELRKETALQYIKGGYTNGTEAYRSACKMLGKRVSKNPVTSAAEILNYPTVKAFINSVRSEAAEQAQVDANFILNSAKEIFDRCTQRVSPVLDRSGEQIRDEDGNPLYVFDAKNALSALKLMGDHVDVMAFKTITETKVTIQDMTDDELDRKLEQLIKGAKG